MKLLKDNMYVLDERKDSFEVDVLRQRINRGNHGIELDLLGTKVYLYNYLESVGSKGFCMEIEKKEIQDLIDMLLVVKETVGD